MSNLHVFVSTKIWVLVVFVFLRPVTSSAECVNCCKEDDGVCKASVALKASEAVGVEGAKGTEKLQHLSGKDPTEAKDVTAENAAAIDHATEQSDKASAEAKQAQAVQQQELQVKKNELTEKVNEVARCNLGEKCEKSPQEQQAEMEKLKKEVADLEERTKKTEELLKEAEKKREEGRHAKKAFEEMSGRASKACGEVGRCGSSAKSEPTSDDSSSFSRAMDKFGEDLRSVNGGSLPKPSDYTPSGPSDTDSSAITSDPSGGRAPYSDPGGSAPPAPTAKSPPTGAPAGGDDGGGGSKSAGAGGGGGEQAGGESGGGGGEQGGGGGSGGGSNPFSNIASQAIAPAAPPEPFADPKSADPQALICAANPRAPNCPQAPAPVAKAADDRTKVNSGEDYSGGPSNKPAANPFEQIAALLLPKNNGAPGEIPKGGNLGVPGMGNDDGDTAGKLGDMVGQGRNRRGLSTANTGSAASGFYGSGTAGGRSFSAASTARSAAGYEPRNVGSRRHNGAKLNVNGSRLANSLNAKMVEFNKRFPAGGFDRAREVMSSHQDMFKAVRNRYYEKSPTLNP